MSTPNPTQPAAQSVGSPPVASRLRGDANLTARFSEDYRDLDRSRFGVVILHERAGIEEVLRQSIFPALSRNIVGQRTRNNGEQVPDVFNSGRVLCPGGLGPGSLDHLAVEPAPSTGRSCDDDPDGLRLCQRDRAKGATHPILVDGLKFLHHTLTCPAK
jgi:hypothetical protein